MPKDMLWTEFLFSFFPVDKENFRLQLAVRFLFLFLVWLTGLAVYSFNGLSTSYLFDPNIYVLVFGMFFLIFVGSFYVQNTLQKILVNFRSLIKLDNEEYSSFSRRLKKYAFSIFPCVVVGIVLTFFTGAFPAMERIFIEGIDLIGLWNLVIDLFATLMSGTAIWMFASIWLTIFLISRQPLSVSLSEQTFVRFRELSMFALWFGLFYFIGVLIANLSFFTNIQTLSLYQIIVSPYLVFVVIGVVGILFPFFNIHNTLLKIKNKELDNISKETESLLKVLNEATGKKDANQTISVFATLFSLQIQEKKVKNAQEWPIDVSFISKLIVIGFIPILSRILAALLIS
ncbi:MAG: hypothetical protein P8Y18_00425 [Candidatus Bathyarchaeota archaeon]